MSVRVLGVLLWLAAVGCGEASQRLTVKVVGAAEASLDPYRVDNGLEKVRVQVNGVTSVDESIIDLDTQTREAVFENLPVAEEVKVEVVGYDVSGNVIAYGRSRSTLLEDAEVTVSLRRNLAYVTHRADSEQDSPGSVIYQIDIATRALVGKIRLPGKQINARSITNRGGESLLVTASDAGKGAVFVVSTDDNSVRRIDLPNGVVQQRALGVEGSSIGVVFGGAKVTLIDLDAGTVAWEAPEEVGGRILDAVITRDGRKAVAVIDVEPGLLEVDLVARTVRASSALPDPGGIALVADGDLAYVTSRSERLVAALNLSTGRADRLNGFAAPVGPVVYVPAMPGLLGLGVADDNAPGKIFTYLTIGNVALSYDQRISTLPVASAIAMDGVGRRAIVVASGTDSQTAGFTVIEGSSSRLDGASALYPRDPDDRYFEGSVEVAHRYRPADVAIVYGH